MSLIPENTADPTAAGPLPDPLALTCAEYSRACVALGLPGGLAGAAERYRRFHRKGLSEQPHFGVDLPRLARTHESDSDEGKVVKFTLAVADNRDPASDIETESVLIPMIGRKGVLTHTLCVSSQIGCAMGCTFCQTAQMGLIRSLTPREIVAQWWAARHMLGGGGVGDGCATIRNLVFMGMGEPMDNLDNVLGAIEVLTDHSGPSMPMNKISISTVGRIDGLRRLSARVHQPGWHRLNLAVSINAPNDEVRSRIMPVNRAMPLAALREAVSQWPNYGAAKICIEYVLIPGVNDAPEHALQLADFVLGRGPYAGTRPIPGLVNIIPYNPRDNSPWPAPTEESVTAFLNRLQEEGVYAKRRRTKGRDTMAACGQLGNPAMRRRGRSAVAITTNRPE